MEAIMKLNSLCMVGIIVTMCIMFSGGILMAQIGADIGLPANGSTFTFNVKATGDNGGRTPILEPMNVNNYEEVHVFKGVIENFYAKGKNGEDIKNVGPYDVAHFEITRPEVYDVVANWYYAIVGSSLAFYYQELTSGDREAFLTPEQFPIVHFPLEEGYSFSSDKMYPFYLNLPKTGISIAPHYESRNYTADEGKIEMSVGKMKKVTVGAGQFDCYPVVVKLTTDTGSAITAAKTEIVHDRCWSPELNYYVTEKTTVFLNALVDSKATIEKELISYK
jgi:hypothetical protein